MQFDEPQFFYVIASHTAASRQIIKITSTFTLPRVASDSRTVCRARVFLNFNYQGAMGVTAHFVQR